jgi:hypothetical protein
MSFGYQGRGRKDSSPGTGGQDHRFQDLVREYTEVNIKICDAQRHRYGQEQRCLNI